MNCIECVAQTEEGNISAVKEHQKNCTVFLNNQCTHYAMRGTFDEAIQDTLININPKKWSVARKVFFTSLVLLVSFMSFITTSFRGVNQDEYMEQLGITPSIVSENIVDSFREGEKTPSLFLYASRNRHFSAFQNELEMFLYSFLSDAPRISPTQAYQLEEQDVILLSGVVTNIQTSSLAETRVWISDGYDRETHSVIWYLNGDQISYSYIGREVQLLTVLEESGIGGHLKAREWLIVSEGR